MSRRILDVADVLRQAGLAVYEVPGWRERGYRTSTTPDGALRGLTGGLVHHTATPATAPGDYPTLGTIIKGRSDVPGPLAQLGLGRDGTWYVIASGRANHSGAVDDSRYSNPVCIGVEAEHPGGTAPWPPEQYAAYVAGCAALARAYGITWRGHKEAAIPRGRKPDPNFDMNRFRADVAAWRPPTHRPTPQKKEEPMLTVFIFPARSADGARHVYAAFPSSRTVEHLGSEQAIVDVKHVAARQGFTVAEWGSEVGNISAFGRYVGPEAARPKGSK